ncbi:DUF3604 domain-containing protein [Aestuariicella sp. G3-2]|uniref:DUF3604 domain-containing protein n=1 Tax=Pseudomaricurvus albidus TaxID=2842452 RepID=UPI001C0AC577|nr:DUF3604 domain-containing protein [Aestuariicella albida]MBU3068797.1 DUF3604 domain-containing protein [Aestuariicella albida]
MTVNTPVTPKTLITTMSLALCFTATGLLTACGGSDDASDAKKVAPITSEEAASPPAVSSSSESPTTNDAITRNPLKDAWFGNLHVHTSWSFDGYTNGSITGPDDAYRWAKGEAIPGGGDGTELQIKVPLDWYIVSDHSEYLGTLRQMENPESPLSQHPLAADITGDDPGKAFAAYGTISEGMYSDPPQVDPILGDPELAKTIWSTVVEIADQHYEPGKFTTMAGYEWTAAPDWRNIHRVVIFRSTANVPDAPFSALDSSKPEDLWQWMDQQRDAGNELLAVPHNGNASNGIMFPVERSYGGSELNAEYAAARMRNEPVYEITQIKGTSETHPTLFPNDEFGNFELWDYTLAPTATPPENKLGGYVREALIRGLKLESEGNGNPFKYGFIGDSDTHNSASSIEEDNYTGKFGFENDPKHRLQGPPGTPPEAARQVRQFSSGGLAGVWAESNTREEIFDAIRRKETFATSGPRLKVRMYGGFGLDDVSLNSEAWLKQASEQAVPMGGNLPNATDNKAPSFIVHAIKDVNGANLDRIQIIKGWVDENGEQQSRIYNVALADGRTVAADGSVQPVGDTVKEEDASYTNTIGDAKLSTVWTDPDFDPAMPALYYARVLQIPTPRWSTYDAARTGLPRPEDLPVSIQERAWTSPIWYTP